MKFVIDPYGSKEDTYSQLIECHHPNCKNHAINSHMVQRNRFLRRIAEDGKVLQMSDSQMQSLMDEEKPYELHDLKDAMSLPVFCAQHDGKLFHKIEQVEPDMMDIKTLLLMSYRAECGVYEQENRRQLFYQTNPLYNPFCVGWAFKEQKEHSKAVLKMFEDDINKIHRAIKEGNDDAYAFVVYDVPFKGICLSDVVFLESDLISEKGKDVPCLSPLYIHALPQDNDITKVALGYRKDSKNSFIQQIIENWEKGDYPNRILELMVIANNWCVSPSYLVEKTDEMCEWILSKKIVFQLEDELTFASV